jgi:hypothetical protein
MYEIILIKKLVHKNHDTWLKFLHDAIVLGTGKGKGKAIPVLLTDHHALKAYWESGSIALRTLDLGTRWR